MILGSRGPWAWGALTAAYAVAVFIAGSIDAPVKAPAYDDKLAHLLVFGGQYLLASRALAAAGRPRRTQVIGGLVAAIGLGAALEAWQSLLPHRTADVADLVADAAGALGAAAFEQLGRRLRPPAVNGRDTRRPSS